MPNVAGSAYKLTSPVVGMNAEGPAEQPGTGASAFSKGIPLSPAVFHIRVRIRVDFPTPVSPTNDVMLGN